MAGRVVEGSRTPSSPADPMRAPMRPPQLAASVRPGGAATPTPLPRVARRLSFALLGLSPNGPFTTFRDD